MKSLLPTLVLGAAAWLVVAQSPRREQAPPGAEKRIEEALPGKPYAKPKKARKLLVFSRTNGYRHASIPTGKLALEELGKKTKAYEVVVSDDLDSFEVEQLKGFDAVCFLSTTMEVFSPSDEERKRLSAEELEKAREKEMRLKDNLMRFVRSGRGFIGIHAATDTFYQWEEYGRMINGCFDGHPWGANTSVSIRVEPGQEKHPLAEMFGGENVEFPEEIYQFKSPPYDSKAVHMLLRLDPERSDMNVQGIKREDQDFGVSWARHWGKGRVFYCSLGHNHEMYWHPKILRHYLAGIQWAMGDYEVEVESRNE